MTKKKNESLEDRFIEVLRANKIKYETKLFNIGDRLYLPDFVFNHLIVEVEDCVQTARIEGIKQFRKYHPDYMLILLTNGTEECLDVAKNFHEVVDFESIELLLEEIRRHLNKGLN